MQESNKELRKDMHKEMTAIRKELRQEMKENNKELREYMDKNFDRLTNILLANHNADINNNNQLKKEKVSKV